MEFKVYEYWESHPSTINSDTEGEYYECSEVDNYVKAIESKLKQYEDALRELVHLHMCEQEGLEDGQPTPDLWYKAVEKAEKALKE